jgi:hypothetical protein
MNLQEQIGVLEAGVDQLIQAASVAQVPHAVETAAPEQIQAAEVAAPEVSAQQAEPAVDTTAAAAADAAAADAAVEHPHESQAEAETSETAPADVVPDVVPETAHAHAAEPKEAAQPAQEATVEAEAPKVVLEVGRPSQNEITMTIGGQTVSLHPLQVGELIEQLANVRASMQPEPPPGIPPGWRFASTKNPMMAVQKQSNGDRLLVMRHTGHGWVPFTFSPDIVVQMYMMLTQR